MVSVSANAPSQNGRHRSGAFAIYFVMVFSFIKGGDVFVFHMSRIRDPCLLVPTRKTVRSLRNSFMNFERQLCASVPREAFGLDKTLNAFKIKAFSDLVDPNLLALLSFAAKSFSSRGRLSSGCTIKCKNILQLNRTRDRFDRPENESPTRTLERAPNPRRMLTDIGNSCSET
jgi:hypothetical protein